jgi:hypothetical protein
LAEERKEMKSIILVLTVLLAWCPVRVQADAQPTAFEKALYDKARYQVLNPLNDDDFVSYCTTMNFGGDTLLKIHDDILVKQTVLNELVKEGYTEDHPEIVTLNKELRNLKAELAAKVLEARKGLQLESKVAEATLAAMAQYQK